MDEKQSNLPQKAESDSSDSQSEAPPGEVIEAIAQRVLDHLVAEAEEADGDDDDGETLIQVAQQQLYIGPLPLASEMAKYDEILPGAAERILKMSEEQGHHRRWMEQNELRWDHHERMLGQAFGFICALAAIVAGMYAALNGEPLAGGLLGTGGVAGLAAVFVYGSRKRRPAPAQEE